MTNSVDPDQLASSDQKPPDLDPHCLLRQGMSCSAKEGLELTNLGKPKDSTHLVMNIALPLLYRYNKKTRISF